MGDSWLTKSEVNALYYNAVAGDIAFSTEGQHGFHPNALARLISRRAATLGKRQVRVLELGANNCSFARSLFADLRLLAEEGDSRLHRVDYLAVEFARETLEAAARMEESFGIFDRVLRPAPKAPGTAATPTLVAYATLADTCSINLGLVHAEANRFVHTNTETFDFVIVNELLDDLPYRGYYAADDGQRFEVVPDCRANGGGWTFRLTAELLTGGELAGLEPRTVTARSEESVELVTGIAGLLNPGGMAFIHDYGFAGDAASLDIYDSAPQLPPFVALEAPSGPFPRVLFRVFGNEAKNVVQVTNDVNFGELTRALEPSGTVFTIPHGNAIVNHGGTFERGQGTFLSELIHLEPDTDLDVLLADLHARQAELRDDFIRTHLAGRGSAFLDLVLVKDR